ncbi:MAG: DUF3325 family protein [Pseudomonadota bacterium]
MSFALGLGACFVAMVLLALAQKKQAALVLAAPVSRSAQLAARAAAALLIVASLWSGVDGYGAGVGSVLFCAWLCAAAWIVALFLSWRRSRGTR